jgi:hypothetical protein
MLDKIRSFNSLVNHIILCEGYFHIPESILEPIKNDFIDVIKYKDDELEKNYKLDFSDTNYDFLNELEPQPSVDVRFTKGKGKRKGSFHVTDSFKLAKNNALIQIDFSEDKPERILSDVIEHELLHFVQRLIKKYNEDKNGNGSLGGLPSKRLLRGLETDKNKISVHTHKPSEMYPNLLSAIRDLETMFNREGKDISKKQFFLNFLKAVKDKKPIGKIAYDVFSDIQDLSKELYRDFVKKAYVAFVEG